MVDRAVVIQRRWHDPEGNDRSASHGADVALDSRFCIRAPHEAHRQVIQIHGKAETVLVNLVLLIHTPVPHWESLEEMSCESGHLDSPKGQEEVIGSNAIPRHCASVFWNYRSISFRNGSLKNNGGLDHPSNQQISLLAQTGDHLVGQMWPCWFDQESDLSLEVRLKAAHPSIVAVKTGVARLP